MIDMGIDPGMHGACAIVDNSTDKVLAVWDLPLIEDGVRNHIDVQMLTEFLLHWAPRLRSVWIENVQPMFGRGKDSKAMMGSASFRFGMVVGQIRTCVTLAGLKYDLVHPQSWKRCFELKGGEKEPSRQLALSLYPDADYWLKRKKDADRAEAILMARYGGLQQKGLRNFPA